MSMFLRLRFAGGFLRGIGGHWIACQCRTVRVVLALFTILSPKNTPVVDRCVGSAHLRGNIPERLPIGIAHTHFRPFLRCDWLVAMKDYPSPIFVVASRCRVVNGLGANLVTFCQLLCWHTVLVFLADVLDILIEC